MTGDFKEGIFKATSEDGDVSWYRVEMTRHPRMAWWITNCEGPLESANLDKITRRSLSKKAWEKLETWL